MDKVKCSSCGAVMQSGYTVYSYGSGHSLDYLRNAVLRVCLHKKDGEKKIFASVCPNCGKVEFYVKNKSGFDRL